MNKKLLLICLLAGAFQLNLKAPSLPPVSLESILPGARSGAAERGQPDQENLPPVTPHEKLPTANGQRFLDPIALMLESSRKIREERAAAAKRAQSPRPPVTGGSSTLPAIKIGRTSNTGLGGTNGRVVLAELK